MKRQQKECSTSSMFSVRRTYSIVFMSLVACIVFLLSGCGQQATSQTQVAKTNTVVMDSSWAEYYKTLKDLKGHTDVAVQGTFTSVVRTVVEPKEQIYTDFAFKITKTVYSHQTPAASVITIQQEGGLYKNTLYRESDDPRFQIGEQSFLFLREIAPNLYVVIGGPTGRFIIQNGSVKPIVQDGVHLPASTNVSDFTSSVQRA